MQMHELKVQCNACSHGYFRRQISNGKYRVDESNCSCNKGEHFCSHLIGLLFLLNTMQQAMKLDPPHSEEQFEQFYRVSPNCVQSCPMLIENAALGDGFKQERSQGCVKG